MIGKKALAAHLRKRAKTADAHLKKVMLLRLRVECRAKIRLERNARAQRSAQIDLVIAKQTGAKSTVGR